MKKVFLKAPYNYDTDAESLDAGTPAGDDGRTQQHQAEEADINVIVKRFTQTGLLPIRTAPPLVDEFTEIFDFHSAQNVIRQATESFNALPADLRLRFGNDPGEFVNFCSDPANEAELVKMGLRPAPPPPPVDSQPTPAPTDGNLPAPPPKP